jgi:hypothetical protein
VRESGHLQNKFEKEDAEMARKDRLKSAAVKIGTVMGRADRKARQVAKAAETARKEIAELSKQVEKLAGEVKKASKRLKKALG